MAAFAELLGKTLNSSPKSTVATTDALADKKAIAFYFSAHWCPPCRGFTPELAEWYKKDLRAKGLEVVFISSDKDQSSYDEYFGEMPWLALPYSESDLKQALSKKFKVNGIPSLVILGPDGKTITTDGREVVSEDPTGQEFPWIPKSLSDVMAGVKLLCKDGTATTFSQVAAGKKALAIYFSAHWCPPCRGFTPKLTEWYVKDLQAKGLEVVFASWDRDPESFAEYWKEQPWPAVDFTDKQAGKRLGKLFKAGGIPSLVVLDPADFSVINTEGREAVSKDPTGSRLPWVPEPVRDLADGPGAINEVPTLLVFCEDSETSEKDRLKAALLPHAEKYIKEQKAAGEDAPRSHFMVSTSAEGLSNRVKGMLGLPTTLVKHEHPLEERPGEGGWGCDGCNRSGAGKRRFRCAQGCDFDFCEDCHKKASESEPAAGTKMSVRMALLDIPSDGAYYLMPEGRDIDTKAVEQFLADYSAGNLERKQLQ